MMDPGILIGALSLGSIGVVLLVSIWHLTNFLRDPADRHHARNVFVKNGKAAATVTAEEAASGSQLAKPMSVRLDESIASQHEVDPSNLQTQAQRTRQFHRERTA